MRLPRIGWVRMREALRFEGDILSVTVSRTAGRWFASFTVDTCEPAPNPRPGPDVGIDMGVKTLATLWDGEEKTEIANPKALEQALADLRATQKAIGRSVKVNGRACTRNRRRLYDQLARQHARVARIRSDHHHKATTQIAKRGGSVTVETLNVDGMKRNRQTGPGDQRHRHGRVRAAAGVQVPLVRHGVPARGPLVSVLKDVQCVRSREAVAPALGAHLPVQSLWL